MIAASVLGLLALVLVGRAVFTESGAASAPSTPTSAATPAPARPAVRRGGTVKQAPAVTRSLDPTLRLDLLKESEDKKYSGSGRNIFVAAMEPIPQPIKPAHTDKSGPSTPPPPPPPPPITLKFFGFASKPGEPKKVFLSQGEDVFIAGEGDIVDRRYRVLRISVGSVEIEDVLNNNRQSIPLTQG